MQEAAVYYWKSTGYKIWQFSWNTTETNPIRLLPTQNVTYCTGVDIQYLLKSETHPSVLARPSLWRQTGCVWHWCRSSGSYTPGSIVSNKAGAWYPSRRNRATSGNHLQDTNNTVTSTHNIHCSRTVTLTSLRYDNLAARDLSSHAARKRLLARQRNVRKQPSRHTRHAYQLPSTCPSPT